MSKSQLPSLGNSATTLSHSEQAGGRRRCHIEEDQSKTTPIRLSLRQTMRHGRLN